MYTKKKKASSSSLQASSSPPNSSFESAAATIPLYYASLPVHHQSLLVPAYYTSHSLQSTVEVVTILDSAVFRCFMHAAMAVFLFIQILYYQQVVIEFSSALSLPRGNRPDRGMNPVLRFDRYPTPPNYLFQKVSFTSSFSPSIK